MSLPVGDNAGALGDRVGYVHLDLFHRGYIDRGAVKPEARSKC
jgi:hypothetical protein